MNIALEKTTCDLFRILVLRYKRNQRNCDLFTLLATYNKLCFLENVPTQDIVNGASHFVNSLRRLRRAKINEICISIMSVLAYQ